MRNLRFRRLERHRVGGTRDNMTLSYPQSRTPSGKAYQYSPNPKAAPRLFLLGDAPEDRNITPENRSRIRREPGPGETVCPYSGYMGPDEDFVHFDDVEAVKKLIQWELAADVNDWLGDWAKDFNRRQPKGGFITMKMEHKPKRRPRPSILREDLLRDLTCDVCARDYGVYAIALFCPDCGAPNIGLHFRRETELISAQIDLADRENGEGREELAYRLMGNAHEDVLTAFETALKTVYRYVVRIHRPAEAETLCDTKAIRNAFQNIDRARGKFGELGIDPFATLDSGELDLLGLNIQKRHVIGHNLGMADGHYVELTQAEQPGETVALIGDDIRRFAQAGLKVVEGLEAWLLPVTQSPPAD